MSLISLTTARTALLNRKRDISDVSVAVFVQWADFINKYLYRQLTNIDPERWISGSLYTVTSAPQTSALPAGFLTMSALGCGLFERDANGNDTTLQLPRTGFGSNSKGFYVTGTNIVFTGIVSTAYYRLRYIPTLTTLTSMSDSVIIDDYYLEYLVNAMDVQYVMWNEDINMNMVADNRFINSMSDLLSCFRKEFGVLSTFNPFGDLNSNDIY